MVYVTRSPVDPAQAPARRWNDHRCVVTPDSFAHDADAPSVRASVRPPVPVEERAGQSPVHALTAARYIQQNVLASCGDAVSRLVRAGVIEYPEDAGLLNEWWLVSDDLARRLAQAGMTVLHLGELNMWGRSTRASGLREDLELAGALRS